ncbi:redoxin family protein [Candidatus Micrarchaeota archaeon]|nr:redoxin family protein [Candidatus Micrarchaeota archaeon]
MTLTPSSYKVLGKDGKAPDFSLPGTDGKQYSLEDFKGKKALLVIFMCNHCPYVRPKMDYFVELQEKYGPEGLRVVGINSNNAEEYPEDSFEKMKEYAEKNNFNFPYLYDGSQEVARAYGAECTPDPFLFDGDFRLKYHGRFDDAHGEPHSKGTSSEMENAIRDVLAGREVGVESLPSMGCSIKWK